MKKVVLLFCCIVFLCAFLPAQEKVMHFSIDDCSLIFKNLTNRNYTSLFDEPVLRRLKALHEKYGLKASLYVFYEYGDFCLANATDEYAVEWQENSDWLKLAPHAYNPAKLTEKNGGGTFVW